MLFVDWFSRVETLLCEVQVSTTTKNTNLFPIVVKAERERQIFYLWLLPLKFSSPGFTPLEIKDFLPDPEMQKLMLIYR
jgi:hypothetical protein